MRLLIYIALISIVSCRNSTSESSKRYDIGPAVITVKGKSSLKELKGIDTYAADLIVNENDTFHLEYGKGIYKLNEPNPTVFPITQKENIEKLSGKKITETDGVFFSETADEDSKQNIFCKQYYLYDTINTIITKIVQPKKIGDGIIGLYAPRLKDGNSLSIYAVNLDSANSQMALQMFKTIKYK